MYIQCSMQAGRKGVPSLASIHQLQRWAVRLAPVPSMAMSSFCSNAGILHLSNQDAPGQALCMQTCNLTSIP